MGKLGKLFGDRVRALRTARRLTQVQLADLAQVSEEWIRRIERGEASPSFETIEALSNALDAQPAELFAVDAERPPDQRLTDAAASLSPDAVEWLIKGAHLLKRSSS
jgi:transcriptional regulator with XRE-family HTH domain